MMRTTDVIVAGIFGPAAIAAIGLANLYSRIPLRIGLGVGTAALALSSQDTGSKSYENRDDAVSQALLIGLCLGIPIAVIGVIFSQAAIELFNPTSDVVEIGAIYLAIVIATAPARHIVLIGEKALQGTGNTVTPMLIRVGTNGINIVGSVVLGLGVGFAPRLEIIGIGIATATANIIGTVTLVLLFVSEYSELTIIYPKNLTIGRQLLRVSTPKILQGLSITAGSFPINAILIVFGVEVYAAYEVSKTIFQQIVGPFGRTFSVVGSIMSGQAIGSSSIYNVRFGITSLGLFATVVIVPLAAILLLFNHNLITIFTSDPPTAEAAIPFLITYGLLAPFQGLFRVYSGALQGGSETVKPFIAEITGVFGIFCGITYLFGVVRGGGVFYAYLGLLLYNVWRFVLCYLWYTQNTWIQSAMIDLEERGSIDST